MWSFQLHCNIMLFLCECVCPNSKCFVLLISPDHKDTEAKLMKCLEYIQKEEERLGKDVDQLDTFLSKEFSKDVLVKFSIDIPL